MTVSTIASATTGLVRFPSGGVTGARAAFGARSADPRDVVTYPSELQKEGVSLRVAVQSVARVGSQLDAASGGASEITALVSQLQTIATRASASGLTDSQREALDAEFQSLRQKINNVVTGSSVAGASLLAGPTARPTPEVVPTNTIGGLTDEDLFGDAEISLLTPAGATRATEAVAGAQNYVAIQVAAIEAAKAELDITATTVESAVQNQEAARASFGESDLAELSTGTAVDAVRAQPQEALLAQTNRLPTDVLKLLVE